MRITNHLLLSVCVIFAVSVFSTLYAQSALSGLPFIRNFHPVEYQAGIQNWDIAQDKRGLLYIANNYGLLEYDGNRWELYRVPNGTKVRSVALDGRGRIYVGCQNDFGYFFPDKRGRLTYTSLADSLPSTVRNFDETWSVYIDRNEVYFCTFSNIYHFRDGKFEVAKPSHPIELSFLVNRELYTSSREAGLTTLVNSELKSVFGGSNFKGVGISSMLPQNGDEFLISTFQHGILEFSEGKTQVWNTKQQQFFKDAIVNCMIRLKNGNIAVGTQNDGLLILTRDGETTMQLTTGKGLNNRTVLSIYEDDLNNLWIGQNNGIAYVELGSPFTYINEQSGLPGTGYAAYLDNNKLYAGTNTGLYVKDREPNSSFKLIPGTRGQIYHIGKYDGVLMAGHHNGAMVINGEGKLISNELGAWVYLTLRQNPSLLVGGSYSGLQTFEKDGNAWKFKNKVKGFSESSRVMAEDNFGNLWMTHGYKGAFKINLSKSMDSVKHVAYYGEKNGFPSNSLINVFRVRNELLFTSEYGVFKYDAESDSFKHDELFTRMLGPSVQLYAIQEDSQGNIYFIGSEHIGVMRKNSVGDYILETNAFNKIRKFLNDDLVNITILKNNEVLFGAKDGFIHYDPTVNLSRKSDFKTIIRNVSITHQQDSVLFFGNYTRNDTLTVAQLRSYQSELDYKNNSINFTFTATSYEGDAQLQYQYYLDRYERTWSAWNDNTQKEYTNLKEGRYTFYVRAKNINGEISPAAMFTFYVNPPWYRSIWAYSFYIISVVAMLFTGFNLLDRKYQRKQRLMALKQKKELNRKEHELNRLSQQSQEEITRLQNEKLESELRHMNNELGTSTMHLLNKNEFITSIKNNLTHIIKKSPSPDVKRELMQITKDIEHNISADSDWEQFQYHFDRVHGDFSTRFKAAFPSLSPQEIKLSAYLRMNLSSKEIAQLLNISIRGVEISRYRLRKKLQLERNTNLQEFILNF